MNSTRRSNEGSENNMSRLADATLSLEDQLEKLEQSAEKEGLPPAVLELIKVAVATGYFHKDVALNGTAHQTYTVTIPFSPTLIPVRGNQLTPGECFTDEQGRTCRIVTENSEQEDGSWVSSEQTWIRTRGQWSLLGQEGAAGTDLDPNPKIFLSHSRSDRHLVTNIDSVLKKYSCETFLDQEKIRAGDNLPDRIVSGVAWCNRFLLFWSRHAAQSKWVTREWRLAVEGGKTIIPYRLDATRLPQELTDLVFVSEADARHGHAELLGAIYGSEPPAPSDDEISILPGKWQLDIDVGVATSTMYLELRANGQVSGKQTLWQYTGSITGTWEHHITEQLLILDIIASIGPQSNRDRIEIRMVGGARTVMSGVDQAGRKYNFRKVG